MVETVEIFEVGPRDGLQNEARSIPLVEKVALVDLLSKAGFWRIEVASFVSPKWVPQMAESAQVLHAIWRAPGVSYAALTPNLRGFRDAVAADASEVAIFGSASEGFSKANINASIEESFTRFQPIIAAAHEARVPVRGYVSSITDCPYDGPVPPENAAEVAKRMFELGCYEVSLADTIGRGTPERISEVMRRVTDVVPSESLAGHFHDTNGRALDNIDAAMEHGIRVFDAAVGGLGGCPYAPGAAGNVATEAVVTHLRAAGHRVNLDLEIIEEAAALAKAMRSPA